MFPALVIGLKQFSMRNPRVRPLSPRTAGACHVIFPDCLGLTQVWGLLAVVRVVGFDQAFRQGRCACCRGRDRGARGRQRDLRLAGDERPRVARPPDAAPRGDDQLRPEGHAGPLRRQRDRMVRGQEPRLSPIRRCRSARSQRQRHRARAARAKLSLSGPALLRGDVAPTRVELVGVNALLVRRADGGVQLGFQVAEQKSGKAEPRRAVRRRRSRPCSRRC